MRDTAVSKHFLLQSFIWCRVRQKKAKFITWNWKKTYNIVDRVNNCLGIDRWVNRLATHFRMQVDSEGRVFPMELNRPIKCLFLSFASGMSAARKAFTTSSVNESDVGRMKLCDTRTWDDVNEEGTTLFLWVPSWILYHLVFSVVHLRTYKIFV